MGGPGEDVGGGAISSLNGPGSGSGADGRSGSGMEASLTSSGYEAGDSVTGNQARGSLPGNEARNSISGSAARNSYLAMKPGIQYLAMEPLEDLALKPRTQHCQCIFPHLPRGSQSGFPATRQGIAMALKPRIFPHMVSQASSFTQAFGRAAIA